MMNRLIVLTLTALTLVFGHAPMSLAQRFEASPFQLVNLAYEGYLSDEGIPSRNRLQRLYNRHNIDAEDLVSAGIAAGYLPESRLSDTVFLNTVSTQMQSLRDRDDHFDWR